MAVLFRFTFFILLALHLSTNPSFVRTWCIYKVASGPEVIPPIRILLQVRVTPEKLYPCLASQNAHENRYSYLWAY